MLPKIMKSYRFQFFVISTICVLCYGFSLDGNYVFDDSVAIVGNTDVTNLQKPISYLFHNDFWGYNITDKTSHKSYRPFTILMFRIENIMFGLKPIYMKLVNLILHTLVSCALIPFFTSFIVKRDKFIPFVAAFIFAIHPIHTEAVAGIVGRAELMVVLIFLIIFSIYLKILKSKKTNHFLWFLIVIFSSISILFKENGITILPILIIYDILKNFTKNKLKILNFTRITILAISTIILIYLRMRIMNFESPKFKRMDNPLAADKNIQTRILSQNYLYSLNLWLLICPDWLSFDWALGSINLIRTFEDYRIVFIALFYIFLGCLLLFGDRNSHLALSLIVTSFLPASGVVKLGFVIAERVLYFPSIGYSLLIALGLRKLFKKFSIKFIVIGFTLFSLCFILKTIIRAVEWKTEDSLFSSALRVCPNNAKVYYNIARLSTDKNLKSTAFEYYHKAIDLHPEYESAIMNLGNLYREMGDFRKAEIFLKKSIKILEEFPAAWMNLGIVQASLKKYNESLKSYHKALKYRKRYPVCLYNLGNLYIEMKNDSMALKYWKETIKLDPKQKQAWANILALLDNKSLIDEVIQTSETALLYNPKDPAILFTRGNAFGKLGNFIESEKIFKEICVMRPKNALYHANLGVLYHRWNKIDDAIKYYKMALKLDPHLKSAHDNLIKLKENKNIK